MHADFCYYTNLDDDPDPFHGMRVAKFLPTEHLLNLARSLKANGFIGFDVTGGEPALHPGIVELAAEARRLGLAMRVITLGQFLGRKMKAAPDRLLAKALIDAGTSDFLLSVHAVNEADFKRITGGSWVAMALAMDYLDYREFDFGTNTTVHEGNFRQLSEIADEIIKHRVYVANLIVMNAYYAWSRPGGAAKAVQGHYGEIRPYLLEARDKLEAAGIAVNIRYAPLCTVKGAERNLVGIVGVRHDPHEWGNQMNHMNPGPAQAMGRRLLLRDHDAGAPLEPVYDEPGIIARRSGKVFPTKCKGCAAAPVCDGIDARYLAERGDSELEPYTEFRGDLLDRERLAYAPAFICKTEPFADARGAVRAAFGMTNR
jgi:pyruvate-formate lyase-activating enzyme